MSTRRPVPHATSEVFANKSPIQTATTTTTLTFEPLERGQGHQEQGRWPSLRTILIATMLPLGYFSAQEPFVRRRWLDTETVSNRVYLAGDFLGIESEYVYESPSFVAISPQRRTIRFRSGRKLRRLPPRAPFVTPSALLDDE